MGARPQTHAASNVIRLPSEKLVILSCIEIIIDACHLGGHNGKSDSKEAHQDWSGLLIYQSSGGKRGGGGVATAGGRT
jgi:hypothetical protein